LGSPALKAEVQSFFYLKYSEAPGVFLASVVLR